MVNCHFCDKELPEEWATHVIMATGPLHRSDPLLPDYPVCGACLKFHGLKMSQLVSKSTVKRLDAQRGRRED